MPVSSIQSWNQNTYYFPPAHYGTDSTLLYYYILCSKMPVNVFWKFPVISAWHIASILFRTYPERLACSSSFSLSLSDFKLFWNSQVLLTYSHVAHLKALLFLLGNKNIIDRFLHNTTIHRGIVAVCRRTISTA